MLPTWPLTSSTGRPVSPPTNSSSEIVFAKGERGSDEHGGVDAPDGDDLARLVAAPVALDVQPRVLAGREVEADVIAVVHHLPVAATLSQPASGSRVMIASAVPM